MLYCLSFCDWCTHTRYRTQQTTSARHRISWRRSKPPNQPLQLKSRLCLKSWPSVYEVQKKCLYYLQPSQLTTSTPVSKRLALKLSTTGVPVLPHSSPSHQSQLKPDIPEDVAIHFHISAAMLVLTILSVVPLSRGQHASSAKHSHLSSSSSSWLGSTL